MARESARSHPSMNASHFLSSSSSLIVQGISSQPPMEGGLVDRPRQSRATRRRRRCPPPLLPGNERREGGGCQTRRMADRIGIIPRAHRTSPFDAFLGLIERLRSTPACAMGLIGSLRLALATTKMVGPRPNCEDISPDGVVGRSSPTSGKSDEPPPPTIVFVVVVDARRFERQGESARR